MAQTLEDLLAMLQNSATPQGDFPEMEDQSTLGPVSRFSTLSPSTNVPMPAAPISMPTSTEQAPAPMQMPQPQQEQAAAPQMPPSTSNDVSDQYSKALQDARQTQLFGNLLKSANVVAAGAAKAHSGANADLSGANAVIDANSALALSAPKDIEAKQKFQEDQLTASVEKDKAKLADPNSDISKAGRDFAKKLGLTVGDNVSYNTIKDLMQESRLYKQLQESVAERLEAAKIHKEQVEESTTNRNQMQQEKEDERKKEKAQLNPGQADLISRYDNAINNLDSLLSQANDKAKNLVGPVNGAVPDVFSSDEKVKFRSDLSRLGVDYAELLRKRGVGLALKSVQLPSNTDTLSHFKTKAETTLSKLKKDRQDLLNNLKKTGKDTQNFELPEEDSSKEEPQSTYSDTQEKGIARVMRDNGVTREEAVKALTDAGKL